VIYNSHLNGSSKLIGPSTLSGKHNQGMRATAHLDCKYILQGIQYGFHIGSFSISSHPSESNMQSMQEYPEVINEYVQKELPG